MWRTKRRMGNRPSTPTSSSVLSGPPPFPPSVHSTQARSAKSNGPKGSTATSPLLPLGPGNALLPIHRRNRSGFFTPSAPSLLLLGLLLLASMVHLACGAADGQWSSHEYHKYSDEDEYADGGTAERQSNNLRITCYTCVNVSNNDECNRFAIDRPCPEGGGDYCLTLHVMDALDRERSVLVNKRCAPLDDCTGDSTGCTTANGQTQCVSCCDQPYCNDSVPSNSTDAVFHRSAASAIIGRRQHGDNADCWRVTVLLVLMVLTFGGPS